MMLLQVIGVNGQEILDSMMFPPSTAVSVIEALVCEALGVPHITLLHEYNVLPTLSALQDCLAADQSNMLMAVAQPLSDEERARLLRMLSENSHAVEQLFKSLPSEAKLDEELVKAFIQADGRVFQHVDHRLLQDRSIVLSAVRKSRRALAITNAAFRRDKEIVLEAAANFGDALLYADGSLFWDSDFLAEIVKRNEDSLHTLKEINMDVKAEPLVKLLSSL